VSYPELLSVVFWGPPSLLSDEWREPFPHGRKTDEGRCW